MKVDKIWNYCSKCNQHTKQQALFIKQKEYQDLEEYEYGKYTYIVLECCGCESISYRTEYVDYLQADANELSRENPTVKSYQIFPKVLNGRKPISSYYIPEKILSVYEQTILALKGESELLTAVGFRAILEAICLEENIKGQNLEQKINNLAKNRFITEKEAERLHTIRFLGNDSVHEMEIPSTKKLYLVLDIIEHLLRNIYIIDNEMKYVLDTIIKKYEEFEYLVIERLGEFSVGDTKTLNEILGKHIRRINTDLGILEKDLKNRIDKLIFNHLSINKERSNEESTFYIILKNQSDFPF